MVVGPGRIRAILDGIWQPGGLLSQNFALVEIGEKGLTVITEASCAEGFHPSSLGRMKSGESAILCQGFAGVQLGVFDEEHQRIAWRWQQALDTREPFIQSVSYFADLGSKVVLIYNRSPTKGVAYPSWNFMLAPGRSEEGEVCRNCEIIGLVVVGEQLRVLSGITQSFAELGISESGESTELQPLKTATMVPGNIPAPCLAQGRDGAVTVQIPLSVQDTDHETDGGRVPNAPPQTSLATIRYEQAWLPHGPDSYPVEDMPCPPLHFEDHTRPALSADLRTWVRGSLGERSLVLVYNLRERLLSGADLDRPYDSTIYAYPGSMRIFRQP
jgi:hypothetical protein